MAPKEFLSSSHLRMQWQMGGQGWAWCLAGWSLDLTFALGPSFFPVQVSCCAAVRTRGQALRRDLITVLRDYSLSSRRPQERARTSGQGRVELRTLCGSKQWGNTFLLGRMRDCREASVCFVSNFSQSLEKGLLYMAGAQ